jgi:hypothetical protein
MRSVPKGKLPRKRGREQANVRAAVAASHRMLAEEEIERVADVVCGEFYDALETFRGIGQDRHPADFSPSTVARLTFALNRLVEHASRASAALLAYRLADVAPAPVADESKVVQLATWRAKAVR